MTEKEYEKILLDNLEKILSKSKNFFQDDIKTINSLVKEIFELDKSFLSPQKKISTLLKIKKQLFSLISSLDSNVFSSFGRDLEQIFLLTNKITKQFLNGLKNSDKKFFKKRLEDVSNVYIKAFESIKKNIETIIDLKSKSFTGNITEKEKKLLSFLESKFKENKFILIQNPNKPKRYYKLNTYIELVNRTNFGNMQTDTALSTSTINGTKIFQITSHATETKICQIHEGKIYTTDQKLTDIFPLLTQDKKPLYHINCQHRIVPKPMTKKEILNLRK